MILSELASMNILFIFGTSVFGYIVGHTIGRLSLIKNLKAHAKVGSLININNILYKIIKTDVLDVKKYEAFGDEGRYFMINMPKPSALLNGKLKNKRIRIRNYIYTVKRSFVIKKKMVVLVNDDIKRDVEWPDPPKPHNTITNSTDWYNCMKRQEEKKTDE